MGCPRCSSGIGVHNAECRGQIEGILLQRRRMKQNQEEEPRGGQTTVKPVQMDAVKPTGLAAQFRAATDLVFNETTTRTADKKLAEVLDVEMDAEDSCGAQVKRSGSVRLEAHVFDDATWKLTNVDETSGEFVTDEDVVLPEVTEELNRLKMLGSPFRAPTVDELMLRGHVYSQTTHERLDDRMVAEGRGRELSTLCAQDALIPRTALRLGTKTVKGRFVDDMKGDRVKSRFVAAEVAKKMRHDMHAGTLAFEDDHQSLCDV